MYVVYMARRVHILYFVHVVKIKGIGAMAYVYIAYAVYSIQHIAHGVPSPQGSELWRLLALRIFLKKLICASEESSLEAHIKSSCSQDFRKESLRI